MSKIFLDNFSNFVIVFFHYFANKCDSTNWTVYIVIRRMIHNLRKKSSCINVITRIDFVSHWIRTQSELIDNGRNVRSLSQRVIIRKILSCLHLLVCSENKFKRHSGSSPPDAGVRYQQNFSRGAVRGNEPINFVRLRQFFRHAFRILVNMKYA